MFVLVYFLLVVLVVVDVEGLFVIMVSLCSLVNAVASGEEFILGLIRGVLLNLCLEL